MFLTPKGNFRGQQFSLSLSVWVCVCFFKSMTCKSVCNVAGICSHWNYSKSWRINYSHSNPQFEENSSRVRGMLSLHFGLKTARFWLRSCTLHECCIKQLYESKVWLLHTILEVQSLPAVMISLRQCAFRIALITRCMEECLFEKIKKWLETEKRISGKQLLLLCDSVCNLFKCLISYVCHPYVFFFSLFLLKIVVFLVFLAFVAMLWQVITRAY